MTPDLAFLELAAAVLRCPVCARRLEPAPSALRCAARHTFDVSRYRYLSLLGGARATSGDDAEMARARERFLATGAYAPLRQAVADLAGAGVVRASDRSERPQPPVVLDVGAGTGYYLAGALEALPAARGIAWDTSVRALRIAARAHPRAIAATWDVFRPFPLDDDRVDVVLDVFAPRNPVEFHRVLDPAGRLVVARPTPRHLAQLRAAVAGMVAIDPAKEERLARALSPYFAPRQTREVEYEAQLDAEQVRDLIGMTPSARHLDVAALMPLGAEDGDHRLAVTVSVLVTVYSPR